MFFGTSTFAVPALQALVERPGTELAAVVTQPDRPAGRGHKLIPTAVKSAALEHAIPVRTPTALRAFAGELAALSPDLCVVASYGRIVPHVLLDAVPLWLNVHPSLLPRYRGATPIQSAIRNGRTETGVTIIAMDAGMDTGDIVAQTAPIAIGADEIYGELHDRLAAAGATLLLDAVAACAAGTLTRTPQDHAHASVTRPLTKADRALRPFAAAHPAKAGVDLVRSLAPKPGAVLEGTEGSETLIVLRAHVAQDHESIVVPARDGAVAIDEVVPPGKRAMPVAAYLRGRSSK